MLPESSIIRKMLGFTWNEEPLTIGAVARSVTAPCAFMAKLVISMEARSMEGSPRCQKNFIAENFIVGIFLADVMACSFAELQSNNGLHIGDRVARSGYARGDAIVNLIRQGQA